MKAIDFQHRDKKMEISITHLENAQTGVLQHFESLLKGLIGNTNDVIIVNGCEHSVSGNTHTITDGTVYYQGLLRSVDSFSKLLSDGQVLVWSIDNHYTGVSWNGDGVQRDTFFDQKMKVDAATSGSGIADFNSSIDFKDAVNVVLRIPAQIQALKDELLDGAGSAFDTFKELADALGNDPNFATSVANSLAQKLNKSGGTMTGILSMGNNKITSVKNGDSAGDAVNKGQLNSVESKADAAQATADRLTVHASSPNLINRIVDLGDWNMNTTSGIFVAIPGFTADDYKKIRSIDVYIRSDAGGINSLFHRDAGGTPTGRLGSIFDTSVYMARDSDSFYASSTEYNATSYNRGWMYVVYEA